MAAPPFTIERIDHVLLHVNGMTDSLKFYETVLGCALEGRMPQFGMAELRAGASHIGLVDVDSSEGAWAKESAGKGRNVDHVALAVAPSDVRALREHLASNNVSIVEERDEDGPQGKSLSLYVRDPSGNTIELLCQAAR
ncbi:MAG TPA: VOC family protein [Candidatus Rubrimentiphilum sp.]|nr:VOC family protein [Candidatus Rubrimentiphilum sp.]